MIEILANIGYVILLINLILFTKSFPKQGRAFKIFTLYLGIIVIVQFSAVFLSRQGKNNLFLSHFYFIGQFVILSFFYLAILKDNIQNKFVKMGLFLGLLALGIQYSNDFSMYFRFNLFEIFITSFLLIIFATFHLYNLLNRKKEFYYINIGILIYLFGSTVLFLAGNLMGKISPDLNRITWILNALLYIVYQGLVFVEWKKSFLTQKLNSKV